MRAGSNVFLPLLLIVSAHSSHLSGDHQIQATVAPLAADADTLQYVQVVWRHGDRTPSAVFPSSEEKKWPEGLGELTKKGIAQQYRLGKWLRSRYGDWLGNGFDRSEVYIRSSDYNRTLMSAQANMAGLFPPASTEIWETDLHWQPVPIHSVPRHMDKQLYEEIPCPVARAELDRVWSSKRVRDIERDNAHLLSLLANQTNSSTFPLSQMWTVFDMLNCQYHHNDTNPLPSWVTDDVFSEIVRVYDLSSQFEFHTELLRRLRGGPLLEDIYRTFLDKRDGLLGDRPKMFAYSAHDTTLAALLATMGIFPPVFPLYATMVIMEMHKIKGQHVIQLYHKNVTDSNQLFRYSIPGCQEPCTLEKLHADMHKYLPENWEKECGLPNTDVTSYIVTICVLAFTTILFGGIIVVDVILKRRSGTISSGRQLLMEDEDISV